MEIVPSDDTAAIWIASREANGIHGVTLNRDQNSHCFAPNMLRAVTTSARSLDFFIHPRTDSNVY